MKLLALLPLLMLGACASRYVEPTDPAATATLTTVHLGTSRPSSTSIIVFSNPECKGTDGFGRLNSVGKAIDLSETPKSSTIAAGSRLYLGVSGWTQSVRTQKGYTDYECTNLFSFTPRAGGKYTVSQKVSPSNTCVATIVETDSGAEVQDLRHHAATPACNPKGF